MHQLLIFLEKLFLIIIFGNHLKILVKNIFLPRCQFTAFVCFWNHTCMSPGYGIPIKTILFIFQPMFCIFLFCTKFCFEQIFWYIKLKYSFKNVKCQKIVNCHFGKKVKTQKKSFKLVEKNIFWSACAILVTCRYSFENV